MRPRDYTKRGEKERLEENNDDIESLSRSTLSPRIPSYPPYRAPLPRYAPIRLQTIILKETLHAPFWRASYWVR